MHPRRRPRPRARPRPRRARPDGHDEPVAAGRGPRAAAVPRPRERAVLGGAAVHPGRLGAADP